MVATINSNIPDLLLFAVVNAVNIMTFFVFVSRVKWPDIGYKLAVASVIMAIPAIVVVVLNATTGCEWLYWVMPLVFVTWTILALAVDIILKIEFRQPRNSKILIPFLLLFYIGLVGMGVLTWQIGLVFWIITAATFTLHLGGMVYAYRHGKG